MLQCVTVYRRLLQRVAVCCSVLQRIVADANRAHENLSRVRVCSQALLVLKGVAVYCKVLQCVAVCCSLLQCFVVDVSRVCENSSHEQVCSQVLIVLQSVAGRCSALQCSRALQYVTVGCSGLQSCSAL